MKASYGRSSETVQPLWRCATARAEMPSIITIIKDRIDAASSMLSMEYSVKQDGWKARGGRATKSTQTLHGGAKLPGKGSRQSFPAAPRTYQWLLPILTASLVLLVTRRCHALHNQHHFQDARTRLWNEPVLKANGSGQPCCTYNPRILPRYAGENVGVAEWELDVNSWLPLV